MTYYDGADVARIELDENQIQNIDSVNKPERLTKSKYEMKIIFCSSYSLKEDKLHNIIYLKNNNNNPVTEFHMHKHMDIIMDQAKQQNTLSPNTHYIALHDLPNPSGETRSKGFADGAIVIANDKGEVESMECTFQHKCLAYNTHWDYDHKFKFTELEESMKSHLNKYSNVDYVVVSCVNSETFVKLNELLFQNPDLANKIVPVDLSYQYYNYITSNVQQQIVANSDGQLSIKIQQWNQIFDKMLEPIQNKSMDIDLENVEKYDKIKDGHNKLYRKQQGHIISNPETKKIMKELLSKTPDIYIPTQAPDEQINKLLVHQLLTPFSK